MTRHMLCTLFVVISYTPSCYGKRLQHQPVLRQTDDVEASSDVYVAGEANATAQQYGDYKIIKALGSGGFGKISQAEDGSGNSFVIKEVLTYTSNAQAEALTKEADALRKVDDCPHVVKFIESGVTPQGSPYLVMHPLAKGDLSQAKMKTSTSDYKKHVDSKGYVALQRVIMQVLETMSCFNNRGAIYSDLKLENLLVASPASGSHVPGSTWFDVVAGHELLATDFGLMHTLTEVQEATYREGHLQDLRMECDSTQKIAAPECLSTSGLYEGHIWSFDMFSLGAVTIALGSNHEPPKFHGQEDYSKVVYEFWCEYLSDADKLERKLSAGEQMMPGFFTSVGITDRCLLEFVHRALALNPIERISPDDALPLLHAVGDKEACKEAMKVLPARPTVYTEEQCLTAWSSQATGSFTSRLAASFHQTKTEESVPSAGTATATQQCCSSLSGIKLKAAKWEKRCNEAC